MRAWLRKENKIVKAFYLPTINIVLLLIISIYYACNYIYCTI